MKKVVLLLVVIAAIVAIFWFQFRGNNGPEAPKQQALTVGMHSTQFNGSVDSLVQAYLLMKDAFAQSDTLKAKATSLDFVKNAGSTNLDDLKSDTTGIYETAVGLLGDIMRNGESIARQPTLADMRLSFKDVSDNLYPFLKTVRYEGVTLYWQTCPMALGADRAANWISTRIETVNPYLGNVGYEAGCGEIQDSIKAK